MKKKGLKAVNKRAKMLEENEVFGMSEDVMTGMPVGCTTIFDTGWETNPRPTYPISNCQSSAKDFHGCAGDCWWPAQVPDGLTNHEDFDQQCPNVARDWRLLNYD